MDLAILGGAKNRRKLSLAAERISSGSLADESSSEEDDEDSLDVFFLCATWVSLSWVSESKGQASEEFKDQSGLSTAS